MKASSCSEVNPVAVRQPQHSKEEFAQRGDALYEENGTITQLVDTVIDTGFSGFLTLPSDIKNHHPSTTVVENKHGNSSLGIRVARCR
jgi:hypothetical protein